MSTSRTNLFLAIFIQLIAQVLGLAHVSTARHGSAWHAPFARASCAHAWLPLLGVAGRQIDNEGAALRHVEDLHISAVRLDCLPSDR